LNPASVFLRSRANETADKTRLNDIKIIAFVLKLYPYFALFYVGK